MKFSLLRPLVYCLAVDWVSAGPSSDPAKQIDQPPAGQGFERAYGRAAEFPEMRGRRIEAAVREGRVGPVEGELMTLMIPDGRDPRARREEISDWRAENAADLAAERAEEQAEKRARGKDIARSEIRAARARQIAEARDSGRIGTLEAEFMALLNRDFESPRERAAALREWRANKGGAFVVEHRVRRPEEPVGKAIRRAKFRNRRADQIAEAVASGRVGPLEGELLTRLNESAGDPERRDGSVRAWMAENREGLANERAARRETSAK